MCAFVVLGLVSPYQFTVTCIASSVSATAVLRAQEGILIVCGSSEEHVLFTT